MVIIQIISLIVDNNNLDYFFPIPVHTKNFMATKWEYLKTFYAGKTIRFCPENL